jgi:hypothetical protein
MCADALGKALLLVQEHVCKRAGVVLCVCRRDGGSARVRVWLCALASADLRVCSVRATAQHCARACTCALRPMHVAKGQRQHVPTADHIVCLPPLLVPLLLSLFLSLTPFSPSSLFCQVRGCCHVLCPTGPLIRAFRRCRPSSSFRCIEFVVFRPSGPAAAGPPRDCRHVCSKQ